MPKSSLFAFLQEIFLKMPKPIVKLTLQCFLGSVIVKRKVSKILSLEFQRLISFYLSLHTKTNPVFHDIVLVRIGRLSLSHSHVVQTKILSDETNILVRNYICGKKQKNSHCHEKIFP